MLPNLAIAFPTFTPGKLISALGITGIAIGFAFKDIFENFLAGILILLTEPVRIDLPFPTHQVLPHDQTEAGDGGRRRQREGWPAGPPREN